MDIIKRGDIMLTKETLSRNLKIVLAEKRMTQAAISEKLNISPQKVSNYFRGNTFPPIDTLVEIAKELGVSLDSLCGIETAKQSEVSKTSGDIAKAIMCIIDSLPKQCEIKIISIIEEQITDVKERCDGPGFIPVFEDVEMTVPAIVIKSGEFRTFLEDLMKMQSLLADCVFDHAFYDRWLNDRIQTLSVFEDFSTLDFSDGDCDSLADLDYLDDELPQ